ncbi:MAG: bifunctional DNA-formamidopyrimidine glycosylase/DNA-(apurinic or apyrimidinic site) lyase [Chloroflexi bacterium]|nr:bifunctional DNA-formamidopyrimidine glycosylase/DNA-(apurinic or apyrimidinic site) lyase [Chloroflexota bacterium]
MPELPEVETIVRDLRPLLVGRRIHSACVFWDRTIAATPRYAAEPPDEPARAARFCLDVAGRRVTDVSRRGKHIVLHLEDGADGGAGGGRRLIIHLRMTGHLLWESLSADGHAIRETGADYVYARSNDEAHTRAVFELDGGRLRFTDTRKFGRIWLTEDDETVLGDLGPEPLADDFTLADFAARLRGRRGRIKPLLLDQRFLAGLGNIYADEALHQAHIHPLRPADTLTDDEIIRLYTAIRRVLAAGIANRGTSLGDFSDYLDAQGQQGEHQRHLLAYGRAGEPCVTCGTPIERLVVGGRSTHVCPRCQPAPPDG